MRVVALSRVPFASMPPEPRRVGRLTPTADGIDLHVMGQDPVRFTEVQAVSVGQGSDGIEIVLVIAGHTRPFHATPLQVSFPDFPFPHRPMVAINLRGLVFHLVKHCPDLVLDEGTAAFLEGGPLARIGRLAEHAAALAQAVADSSPEP